MKKISIKAVKFLVEPSIWVIVLTQSSL